MPLKDVEVSFETPDSLFGIPLPKLGWKGTLAPDDSAQRLAWALYVELSTRILEAGLAHQDGSLREALSSYYSLFQFTRDRLREVGPRVGRPTDTEGVPIAAIALWMLNGIIRPLLARWHPALKRFEESRPDRVGAFTYEAEWPQKEDLRRDLEAARCALVPFARLFERVCGVDPSLLPSMRPAKGTPSTT
jgi:hypothetical protein